MKPDVLIRELGPREGFQILPEVVSTEKKLQLINALAQARVPEMEVTSFVRADKVPQLADADEVVANLPEVPSVAFTALCLNKKGFERAVRFPQLHHRGWIYTALSDTFLKENANTSISEGLAELAGWVALFRAHNVELHGLMISTAFGCAREGAFEESAILELCATFQAEAQRSRAAFQEVCLADTDGLGDPNQVRSAVRQVRALGVDVSLHLHDKRGLAVANLYAGLLEGVSIVESSVGGLGGCPFTSGAAGNIATEEVVYLCERLGLRTGVDLDLLLEAARVAEKITGSELRCGLHRLV